MELKEFLYVDVDRTRSLLAQLAGGVTNEVRDSISNELQGRAQAAIFGIGAGGQYARGSRSEEARSMQDLIFVEFERRANENGLITELGPEFMQSESWHSGEVHRSLVPGQLARVECDVHLLDGSVVRARLDRFVKLMEAIADMNQPAPASGDGGGGGTARSAVQRSKALREARLAEMMGGTSPATVGAISSAVNSVVGDSVSMRILPCGSDALDCSFTGSLLGRREYLQEERENLFSRYGQRPSNWIAVFQVAAIPEPHVPLPSGPDYGGQWLNEANELNRAKMESDVNKMLTHLEQSGVVEGPRWPSISVTPLGLYRTVPVAD